MPRTAATEALCGAVGGTAGALVAYPIDTVKTRLQAGGPRATLGGTISQLFRAEGPRGFYRGVQVMGISQGLYIGAAIGGMQAGRQMYDRATGIDPAAYEKQGEPLSRLVFGGIVSGTSCGTVATPFERLRVLLQTQAQEGARSPIAMVRHVVKQGGSGAMLTGLPITVIREIPGCIIWIGSWDVCFRYLSTDLGWERQPTVFASAVFAATCWSLSIFPFERIKVAQQTASTSAKESIAQTMVRIFRTRGVAGFAVGAIPLTCRNITIDIVQLPSVDMMRQKLGN
jgi:hypothetical protein